MHLYTIKRQGNKKEKNDHQRENSWIFYQILATDSLRKYKEFSLENLYVDLGASSLDKV